MKNNYFHKQTKCEVFRRTHIQIQRLVARDCVDSYRKDLHAPSLQRSVLQASKRTELWTKIVSYSFRDDSSGLPHPFYAALERGGLGLDLFLMPYSSNFGKTSSGQEN